MSNMETVNIPGIPRPLTRVALGTWAIGGWMWGGADDEQSIATIHRALDLGVNVVDTAPVYGFGRSEEVVGRALEGRRDDVVVATKVGLAWDEDENVTRDTRSVRIRKEVEDSLRRLRTDRIDLYQVHWPDPHVPAEETASTLEELRKEGKILAIGVSNYSPEQMDAFRQHAPLATVQPPYNLFEREIEGDVLPYARQNDLVVLAYGSLCRGMLSGKMSRQRSFEGDDLRQSDPKFQEPRFGQYLDAVAALEDYAREEYGRTLLTLAIRWILDQGPTVALWGARRPDQLDPVEGVFGWQLSDEDRRRIDTLIAEHVRDPVGPEFMAPPARDVDAARG